MSKIKQIGNDIEQSIKESKLKDSSGIRYSNNMLQFEKFDELMESNKNAPRWLKIPQVAEIVVETLHIHDSKKYNLIAYCLMPTHVHLILRPLLKNDKEPFTLSEIMHSIKTYTANECNKNLGRTGQFWSHESYDHTIRDNRDFINQIEYLVNNPVKAGLVESAEDWLYTWITNDIDLII
jgi:REP element-mobilizing transposase RayT